MAEMKWTEEQQNAIRCGETGEILVSAAAGSGKTAVLTRRILELGLEGKAMPEELAVMTFTEKAAANMREGIEEKLAGALESCTDEAGRERLNQFKSRLPLAQISTIHSFCLRLIREYQNELEDHESILSGMRSFSVLSGQELNLLREEALDRMLSELYCLISEHEEGEAPALPADLTLLSERPAALWLEDLAGLAELFSSGGSDTALRDRILAAHAFLRSLPDYGRWCRRSLESLEREAQDFPASETAAYYFGRLDAALEKAAAARSDLEHEPFYADIFGQGGKSQEKAAFRELYPLLCNGIETLRRLEGRERWNEAFRLSSALQDWKALRKAGNEDKMSFYELFYRKFGPLLALLDSAAVSQTVRTRFAIRETGVFWLCAEEIEAAARAQLPCAARFLELVLLLDFRLSKLKKQRRRIDFSDLEHTALLLSRKPEIGESLRRRYREIMIDEYQDSSPLQEAMIRAIACERVYMVGDIKQSIYRFRHAEPRLFASKLERFVPAGERTADASGHYLLLNRNFRSHPVLISWINRFFHAFLRKETGGIDYDEDQALIAGRTAEQFPDRRVKARMSLLLTTEGEELPDLLLTSEQKKSCAVLSAVRQLQKEGFALGEIAILCRTHDSCSLCLDLLLDAGIPAVVGSSRKYLDTPELRLLEQWTRLMGNALQDLPLAAVMRSPLHGTPFQEQELLAIARLELSDEEREEAAADGGTQIFFYRRLSLYSRSGSDETLRKRCADFLKTLEEWRQDARILSLSRVLTGILEKSGWTELLSRLPYGGERVRDVENFIRLCEEFERNIGYDPVRFARVLSALREKKVEVEGFDKAPDGGDCVRIMTIHASKGLEFPAVIYPRAERRNSSRSAGQETFILDAEGGIAAHYAGEKTLIRSPRALRLKEQIDFSDRAEDFRLLYVCLTRAVERVLVLGYTEPSFAFRLAEDFASGAERDILSDEAVRASGSDFELLTRWALTEIPGLAEQFARMDGGKEEELNFCLDAEGFRFCARTLRALLQEAEPEPAGGTGARTTDPEDRALIAADPLLYPQSEQARAGLAELLQGEIPGCELLLIPSKLTVSELQKQSTLSAESRQSSGPGETTEYEQEPGERPLYIQGLDEMALRFRRPEEALEREKTGTGAAYGSFLHRLLQHLPVERFFDQAEDIGLLPGREAEEAYRAYIREELRLNALGEEEISLAEQAWPLIRSFLSSGAARCLCEAERRGRGIWRETPFTLSIPAPGIPESSGEISLVQGMIDLFFVGRDGLVLVDYKSDSLRGTVEERDAELRRSYSEQMNYYREAIRRIYGEEPKKILLWVIREGRALEI